MSRGPNTEQIVELRAAIRNHQMVGKQLAKARAIAMKIPDLEKAWTVHRRKIAQLLEVMDCKSDGNHGWEHRITTLLDELIRQEVEGL